MRFDPCSWPTHGPADPPILDTSWLTLPAQHGQMLWFSPALNGATDPKMLQEKAWATYRVLRAHRLAQTRYFDLTPPQPFHHDLVIAIRLTERGRAAKMALLQGFSWDTDDHAIDQHRTLRYWRQLVAECQNPYGNLFDRIQRLVPALFEPIKEEAKERQRVLWRRRLNEMTVIQGHDWSKIIGTTEPHLADIAQDALQQHCALWMKALQSVTNPNSKLIEMAAALDDTKYRDVKNEAMFVKMRVWTPLDDKGRRVRS